MDFKRVHILKILFVCGLLSLFSTSDAFAGRNGLGNSGIELAIGSGTASNWDSTNGAERLSSAAVQGNGFDAVPEGGFAIELDDGEFSFQVVDGVKAGELVTFTALAQGSDGGAGGGRLKIEFKRINADGSDTLIDSSNVSDFINTTTAQNGSGSYVRFTAQGVAPEGTDRVVFTIETSNGTGGITVFDRLEGTFSPATFSVNPSDASAQVGSPVLFNARFVNPNEATVQDAELVVEIPSGFHVDQDAVFINNQKATVRQGSLIITMGSIPANSTVNVAFVLIPTSQLSIGNAYNLPVRVRQASTQTVFGRGNIIFVVEADPVFQEGTVIGKVFDDRNKNGIQDKGEKGVPRVKLVTEEGIVITTDNDGKYHVPALLPGRHLIKIDGHSLPRGTEFVTEETYLIRTTPGILSKANFAVYLPESGIPEEFSEDLEVMVTQGLDYSKPKLDIQIEPELLLVGGGTLQETAYFKFDMNYTDFIKRWYVEIRDELGTEVWTGFGVGKPPHEVPWEGNTEEGLMVKPGIYSYQIKVEDAKGRQDWSVLKFFRVFTKGTDEAKLHLREEIPSVGDFNIFEDGKRSIPLVAKPTLRVQGKTKPDNQVMINDYPVSVDSVTGNFQKEFFTTPGDHEILISTTTPEGETTSVNKSVTVDDNMFFMVALGEQEFGQNLAGGNLDTAAQDDRLKDGFYQDGRLAYYLVGKLKGKFLIKSHYDTQNEKSALFTNLDPEEYYPVYGDASKRDYEAQDAHGKFFLVLEMDRSFIKWGSFETGFTDTELATYNRTLSGLKAHYESTESTPYGDPKKAASLFWSSAGHRPDHIEFAATGGTLYYTRNRNVIEGSEKLRVEIRDKVQDIAIQSYDLEEGTDYEIDYREGRIILNSPLSSVSATDTLITNDLMNGNQVFLIVDYEFDTGRTVGARTTRGLRGYTHFGDHIKIGGTLVEDKQTPEDYDLRAVDATFKIGRNTKITAEYAETKREQVDQAVSYNGGLTFADLAQIRGEHTRNREYAYLVKGQSKPVKNLELTGYVQGVQPSFSTDRTKSQEATKKYGLSALYKIGRYGHVRYRYDHNETSDGLLPAENNNVLVPFESVASHILQAAYDDGRWLFQAEYLHRNIELPNNNLSPSLTSELGLEDGIAAKAGYHVNDKLLAYVKAQTSTSGQTNNQFGGGLRYEISKDIFAYVEQMVGNLGDSTYLGFEKQHEGGARSYVNIRSVDRGIGNKTLTTAVGSSMPFGSKSRIFSEREHSLYNSEEGYADILGAEGKVGSQWDYVVKYERRHLDNASTRLLDRQAANALLRTNTFNTLYGSISYTDKEKIKAKAALEYRRDQDEPRLWQVVSRNYFDYQITPDLAFRTHLNYGVSQMLNPSDRAADFAEFNTGFAYRPIAHDKLNVLARYTYLRNIANDEQFRLGFFGATAEVDEISHVYSIDVAYDINKYFGIVEKFAFKHTLLRSSVTESSAFNSFLWAHRFNFHVTRKWDAAVEYRIFMQYDDIETLQHGALIEVDREFYEYVRLGVGYDFTDFQDDLTESSSYQSHGPFVRLTGKF